MRKTFLALAAAAAVLSFGTMAAEAKTKACYIYVGPIGDFGWSYQHHQGALEAQKNLGEDNVEVLGRLLGYSPEQALACGGQ